MQFGHIAKAIVGFITSGGAIALANNFGVPMEIATPAGAFAVAVMVYLWPNAKTPKE